MQVQPPDPSRQTWHITFGTYATRLHNDPRPTVDRLHNQINTPFPPPDTDRQQPPTDPPLRLTLAQRHHIEPIIPRLCDRGGSICRTCAAPSESDHVHVLLDAPRNKHPKDIRKWLKRWLSQSLTKTFGQPPKRWWAEGGSTKPVKEPQYLKNATNYINRQRTLPIPSEAISSKYSQSQSQQSQSKPNNEPNSKLNREINSEPGHAGPAGPSSATAAPPAQRNPPHGTTSARTRRVAVACCKHPTERFGRDSLELTRFAFCIQRVEIAQDALGVADGGWQGQAAWGWPGTCCFDLSPRSSFRVFAGSDAGHPTPTKNTTTQSELNNRENPTRAGSLTLPQPPSNRLRPLIYDRRSTSPTRSAPRNNLSPYPAKQLPRPLTPRDA